MTRYRALHQLGEQRLPSGTDDAINRAQMTQKAQAKTDQVIRSGYDPHASGYMSVALQKISVNPSASATYRDEARMNGRSAKTFLLKKTTKV